MSDYLVQFNNISKFFGKVIALKDVTMKLKRGEIMCLLGDNGAGKSTFVRNITGVEQPTGGRTVFYGDDVKFASPLDAREAGIETVYQNLALADHLDVPANIFLGREDAYDAIKIPGLPLSIPLGPFAWMKAGSMRDHAAALLEKTGVKIPDLSESLAGMSGGQRQCVAIARAAGWGKKLIIMDEHCSTWHPRNNPC